MSTVYSEFMRRMHPETAALAYALAHVDATAPHTGAPWSEAMLLGLGGGLGAGYVLWTPEHPDRRTVTLGFRHRWNDPLPFIDNVCGRLGAVISRVETSDAATAADDLDARLAAGDSCLCQVDIGGLPYRHQPTDWAGWFGWLVTAVSGDADTIDVLDLADAPFRVPRAVFAAARAAIPSFEHRLVAIAAPERPLTELELRAALRDALVEHVEHLGADSKTYALPTWRRWARRLTDPDANKGWPRVFDGGRDLFDALSAVYEQIEHRGGALRGLYAEFLREAATILDTEALLYAADLYCESEARWTELAHQALPDRVPALAAQRARLDTFYALLTSGGDAADTDRVALAREMTEAADAARPGCPTNAEIRDELLMAMRRRLEDIDDAETEALDAVRAVLDAVD